MTEFKPKRPDFKEAVSGLLAATPLARTLGVHLDLTEPGRVVCSLDMRPELGQQNGFAHAGILATLADFACGLAAYSLMADGENVLSTNINVSLMRPANGQRLRAEGRVVKAGARVYFTEAEIYAVEADSKTLTTKVTATMMAG